MCLLRIVISVGISVICMRNVLNVMLVVRLRVIGLSEELFLGMKVMNIVNMMSLVVVMIFVDLVKLLCMVWSVVVLWVVWFGFVVFLLCMKFLCMWEMRNIW